MKAFQVFKGVVLFIATLAMFTLANTALAQVSGSSHDLATHGVTLNYVCESCHAPHNTKATPDIPLQNRDSTAIATFTLYTSPSGTLNAALGQPTTTDRVCMGCHDNTIALDKFGANAGTTKTISTIVGTTANLGTDLSNDHPVSFAYDSALATADGGLANPVDAAGSGLTPFKLFNSQMKCASCHDVHNQGGVGGKFLRTPLTSTFCTTCHSNK